MTSSTLRQLAREVVASLLALVAEQRCAACGGLVASLAGCVCDRCRRDLLEPRSRCPLCALPRPDAAAAETSRRPPAGRGARRPVDAGAGPEDGPCARCARRRPRLVVVAAWGHGGTARSLVHALKYGRRREAASALSGALGADPAVRRLLGDVEALVPVPAEPLRQRRRGFNQARLLAEGLADQAGTPPVVDVLRRATGGPPQTALGGAARRGALRGRVWARRGAARRLRGRRVALVDDVVTTGSTALEAARALRAAGATVVGVVACTRSAASGAGR